MLQSVTNISILQAFAPEGKVSLLIVFQCKKCIDTNEIFETFVDRQIIAKIVECTNINISSVKDRYQDSNYVLPITEGEMKAVIGLLVLVGTFKSSRRYLREFWTTDGTGVEIFPAVLGFRRMKFLLQCVRFNDIYNRDNRQKVNKFAPMRDEGRFQQQL